MGVAHHLQPGLTSDIFAPIPIGRTLGVVEESRRRQLTVIIGGLVGINLLKDLTQQGVWMDAMNPTHNDTITLPSQNWDGVHDVGLMGNTCDCQR
jgi:hypothetical protein